MYDDDADATRDRPFNYYFYSGSNTAPPCAEYVYWIVSEEEIGISSTVIGMFYDALNNPEEEFPSVSTGNNRYIFKQIELFSHLETDLFYFMICNLVTYLTVSLLNFYLQLLTVIMKNLR